MKLRLCTIADTYLTRFSRLLDLPNLKQKYVMKVLLLLIVFYVCFVICFVKMFWTMAKPCPAKRPPKLLALLQFVWICLHAYAVFRFATLPFWHCRFKRSGRIRGWWKMSANLAPTVAFDCSVNHTMPFVLFLANAMCVYVLIGSQCVTTRRDEVVFGYV